MNFIKCKICREPFCSHGSPVCPACLEKLDEDFLTVRDYIDRHPNQSNVEQIVEATGVKEIHVVYLLETGRLSVKGDISGQSFDSFGGGLKCQICGRGISSGSLCESCKGTLSKELGANMRSANSAKSTKAGGTYVSPRSSKSPID